LTENTRRKARQWLLKDGTGMVAIIRNNRPYLFVMKGAKTDEFYLYDRAGRQWLTDSVPKPPPGTKLGYKKGSCLPMIRR